MDVPHRERLDLVFLVFGCLLHWFVARLSWLWGRNPSLWVFGARSGTGFADNAKYLFLHVSAHHPDIRPVWLTKNKSVIRELRSRGYETHHTYSLRGLYLNLRAGVVCFTHGLRDINFWCSGGARAVLLWHGTPLKNISWDSHFPDAALPVRLAHRYAHRVLDLVTVTTEELIPVFVSGLRVDSTVIAVTGYPRNDALTETIPGANIGSDRTATATFCECAANHTVILYLPTFRDTSTNGALDALDPDALDSLLARHDAYLFVKTHPDDPLDAGALTADRIRHLPAATDAHSLLGNTDVLITDYSSIFFDFLLLDRPIVFYAHDLCEYRTDRGFYFDYDSVTPGPVARTKTELRRAIDATLEDDGFAAERETIRNRFCRTDGNRSEAVYEAVCNLL